MEFMKWSNHEEWLNIRRRGIGGSDAAAIMGFSPFRTPYEVWEEKFKGISNEPKNKDVLKFGTFCEDYIAREYAERTGYKVCRYNYTVGDGVLLANVDRLVNTKGKPTSYRHEVRADLILECKTTSDFSWEDVPFHYQSQCQHYMGLFYGIQQVDVAVFFKPTCHVGIFHVYRQDETIYEMQLYLKDWWSRHVQCGIPPEPVCESDCRKLWKHSNPEKTVMGSESIIDVAQKIHDIRRDLKEWEEEEERLRCELAVYMRDASRMLDPVTGKTVLEYKTQRDRANVDRKSIIEDLATRYNVSESELIELTQKHTKFTPGARPITFSSFFGR